MATVAVVGGGGGGRGKGGRKVTCNEKRIKIEKDELAKTSAREKEMAVFSPLLRWHVYVTRYFCQR